MLGEAVEGAKGVDDEKLADYMHKDEFKTVVGDVQVGQRRRVGESGMLTVQ